MVLCYRGINMKRVEKKSAMNKAEEVTTPVEAVLEPVVGGAVVSSGAPVMKKVSLSDKLGRLKVTMDRETHEGNTSRGREEKKVKPVKERVTVKVKDEKKSINPKLQKFVSLNI